MKYEPEYRALPRPKQNQGFWVLVSHDTGRRHELFDETYPTEEAAQTAADARNARAGSPG